jgi:hypothetical protein
MSGKYQHGIPSGRPATMSGKYQHGINDNIKHDKI